MNEATPPQGPPSGAAERTPERPSLRTGWCLFRRLLIYHAIIGTAVVLMAMWFPGFTAQLPIGGVSQLVESGDLTVTRIEDVPPVVADLEIVDSVIRATSGFDRLGYARQLGIILIGVWLLMLPVSWVHRGIHQNSAYDHSLDETALILPGVVAAIVLVVQHSLALAFSLAGIVAGVQFRRALQDTFDALFILVAIGTGIAAGVEALEIAAVLTVFFSYATLYVYYFGDGFQSDYLAQKKALKVLRKQSENDAARDAADDC